MSMRRQAGFTLIEMLVVITLVGLMAAVVAPSVGAGVETLRLRSSAERLAATLKLARERAVRTRHYHEVAVDPELRRVEMKDLEGDYARDWEIPETLKVIADCGLRIADCQTTFLFSPDGSVPPAKVLLENSRGRRIEVVMDPFTAFATTKEPS